MKKFHLLPLFLLASFIVFGQSFNRSITKVSINGSDYTTFPINYSASNNSPLSVTVYFTYQKTDSYNHSYGAGGKFFINNANVNSFTVPNLDNNQPWNSSISSLSVPISNINSLDLRVRITTQAPDSPNPALRDYDTQTVRINVQKPILNNTISAPQETYNHSPNLSVTLTGSQPTGGNGSYTYQWYKKKWDESSFSAISGGTGKNLTTGITEHTIFYRKVYSGTASSNSSNKLIRILHSNIENNYIGQGSFAPYNGSDEASNETVNGFIVIGDSYYASGRVPQIPTINVTNQSSIWQYQWQSKLEDGNWTNISGATTQEYTITNLTQNTYFRRVATSDHLLNNPKYSNLIYVTVLNQSPVGNNIINLNQNDPYAHFFEGSIPSGGEGVNYLYSWYARCYQENPTPMNKFKKIEITPVIGGPSDPTNVQSLTTYNVSQANNFNVNQCENGYQIRRHVSFLSSNVYSSVSNVLSYGVQESYVNVSQQQSNMSNVIMECMGLSGNSLRLEVSRNFSTFENVLNFTPSNNNFIQTWTIPSSYGSGMFNYRIYSNNQIIKSGVLYRM